MTPDVEAARPPVEAISIVAGHPTSDEIAAVVLVLATRSQPTGAEAKGVARSSAWSDPARRLRPLMPPGPDSWRRTGQPR